MRGVVAGDGAAFVGKLRVVQLIDSAGGGATSDAGSSAAHRDDSGAVGAFEKRAGVCGDGPGRPFARFVGGGLAAGEGDADWRTGGDVFGIVEIAVIEHQDL